MKVHKLFILAVAASLALIAQSASASTIPYTCTSIGSGADYTQSCTQFNPSLGTLTAVTIELVSAKVDFSDLLTGTSRNGGSWALSGITGVISVDAPDPTIEGDFGWSDYVSTPLTPSTVSSGTLAHQHSFTYQAGSGWVYSSPATTYTTSTGLSPFQGASTWSFISGATIEGTLYFSGVKETPTTLLTNTWRGTYEYDRVPEPTTLGMALGGVICLMFGVRRTRRA
jgi:hypothetical protein